MQRVLFYIQESVKASLVRWYLSRGQKQVRDQAVRVSIAPKMVPNDLHLPIHSLSVTYCLPSKEGNRADVKDAISEMRLQKRLWPLAWEPFPACVSWEKQVVRLWDSPVEEPYGTMEKSANHHLSELENRSPQPQFVFTAQQPPKSPWAKGTQLSHIADSWPQMLIRQ